jgi:hypothetical protein
MPGALLLVATEVPAAPIVGVMTLGVVVALVGHVAKSYRVVAVGIAILFLATAAMVVGAYVSYHGDETDPRPAKPPSQPGF